MARASKVEACMICDQVPCICNAKTAAPKKNTSAQRPSMTDRMRAGMAAQAAAKRPATATPDATPGRSVSESRVIPTTDVEQLIEDEAIRALEPLMRSEDKEKYKTVLTSTLSLSEKAMVWRWRREHGAVG
jgi:hypothetical protein